MSASVAPPAGLLQEARGGPVGGGQARGGGRPRSCRGLGPAASPAPACGRRQSDGQDSARCQRDRCPGSGRGGASAVSGSHSPRAGDCKVCSMKGGEVAGYVEDAGGGRVASGRPRLRAARSDDSHATGGPSRLRHGDFMARRARDGAEWEGMGGRAPRAGLARPIGADTPVPRCPSVRFARRGRRADGHNSASPHGRHGRPAVMRRPKPLTGVSPCPSYRCASCSTMPP
jgi:hypothetical protein